MEIRVITLRYTEGAQGFPEEALRRATAGREVLETSEHFFVYGNVPHLTLVLKLGGEATGATGWREKSNGAPDLELELPDSRKGVFRAIKKWRNEKAKSEGKPAYAIMRNVQVLEIVKAMPQSLAGLKEIEGIGEATAEAYGKEILEILSNAPPEVSPGPRPARTSERRTPVVRRPVSERNLAHSRCRHLQSRCNGTVRWVAIAAVRA